MCILDHWHGTSFCLWKFLKKLADDQCSFITKGSIYFMKHMYIQPFSMEVDWPEIWCFNGSIYNVLYLYILCFYFVQQYNREITVLFLEVTVLLQWSSCTAYIWELLLGYSRVNVCPYSTESAFRWVAVLEFRSLHQLLPCGTAAKIN